MDKRKNYYLMIDTETANGLDEPLVYDIGGAIVDKKGKVYEAFSFVIYEVFVGMRDVMDTAYYADKLPKYQEDLDAGLRRMVRYKTARDCIFNLCKEYNVKGIVAHNMRFDYRSTTTTQRYLTKSKYRYFLPYGIPLMDTLKMAQDTICKQKSFIRFCQLNGYVREYEKVIKNEFGDDEIQVTEVPRATAEVLYKYIIDDTNFKESHTGLEDVYIEKEIFARCMRQHKKMRTAAFNPRKGLTMYEKIKYITERQWEVQSVL